MRRRFGNLQGRRDASTEREGRRGRRRNARGRLRSRLRGYVLRCGDDLAATMGDDAGRTRTQNEGKRNHEAFPRVGGHLTEELLKGQNKSSKNPEGRPRRN